MTFTKQGDPGVANCVLGKKKRSKPTKTWFLGFDPMLFPSNFIYRKA